MRSTKSQTDFKDPKRNSRIDDCYDLDFDAILIEESIAKQYHILPSDQENLSYPDWAKLVSGLMNDTPLGKIVEIRSEDDSEIIKKMTPEQKAIRNEWADFKASKTNIDLKTALDQSRNLEKMIAAMFR